MTMHPSQLEYFLNTYIIKKRENPLTLPEIFNAISKVSLTTAEDMIGVNRRHKISEAREIYIGLAYYLTDNSITRIALQIKKNHSTVVYFSKTFRNHYELEPEYKHRVNLVLETLEYDLNDFTERILKRRAGCSK